MMQQWMRCKSRAKDALLLFRLGDFYEAFHEDAHILARDLELTLTKRQGIPMSGVPAQNIETYIEKLLTLGHLIAIAEQVEDPKNAKGIVKREVTRIISPATHMESSLLKDKSNNFFASVCQVNRVLGLSFLDITTGEMLSCEVSDLPALFDELYKKSPSELLLSSKFYKQNKQIIDDIKKHLSLRITLKEEWHFDHKTAHNFLSSHFKVQSLDAFGLKGTVSAINAAGVLLAHLAEDLSLSIDHVKSISLQTPSSYLALDHTTLSHLDIIPRPGLDPKASLLHILDQTATPMGGRKLVQWVLCPLLSTKEIANRSDGVEELLSKCHLFDEALSSIRDLERLTMKLKTETANPRDLLALATSLESVAKVKELYSLLDSEIFQGHKKAFFDFSPFIAKIQSALDPNPPVRITEGGIFQRGFHQELDEYYSLKETGKDFVTNYQEKLKEELDIKTLKVNYTRAFGYYIEVSRLQSQKMHTSFERRQTLVNTERFISPELKEFETKILGAEEKILSLEYNLFIQLRKELLSYADNILACSSVIATLDCLNSFAIVAKEHNYKKPIVDSSDKISIVQGRHPIIESTLSEKTFIPNDVLLNRNEQRLLILTGPNMAGKSTYMRQVALIVLMAQMGSFVPVHQAHIGIVDKLFSRIGASDNLSKGQSTFMVEMLETANILNNATKNSLVILDEIGRGTSTYDGISIAWAVAKHLLNTIGAKTLFATHYWELTRLEAEFPGVKNFKVAVQENEDGIVFLHKILQGHADKSYGIHVAKLAGLPSTVIASASSILKELESTKPKEKKAPPQKNKQFLLFSNDNEESFINDQIRQLDINKLTPMEALQKLFDWKKLL